MSTEKITVDGIDYTMHADDGYAAIYDASGLVAEASIDHNIEQIGVTYYNDDGPIEDRETSVSYWEFSEGQDIRELARWMAATHPFNS